MIQTVLEVLKTRLNEFFRIKTGEEADLVKFIDSGHSDPISFTNNAVTPFLINVSEDRVFRNADQYTGVVQNGVRTQFNPEIRIELLVLFVSKFSDYKQALTFLSYIIKCFQANRIYTQKNCPELAGENIEKLIMELVSLPLQEQNQVWHSLNTSYLPSVLYRIRLLHFVDEEGVAYAGEGISHVGIEIN
ncbi:DUF4255 domain-containing protein [Fulvivirga maritima]|uniref:DUF4255 domain-containing protein n=1 Tax=Fulvivirga maritima TaxID=2904247 RepID=UPI001F1CDDFF|nr:DUF4255 domain-containing protein [Fulvivirga maritima]UII24668.1 DUF4255 domain-containing protein [Fulvivirga maritima]